MKNINFINCLSFAFCMILSTSCEKSYQIGGYFVNEINDKPIIGLEIGLYKGLMDVESTINDFELKSSTFTDSTGKFNFEIGDEELNSYYYFPIPTSDTNSVNSKFVVSFKNINTIDWSKTRKWSLRPSTITQIVFEKSDILDSLILKYENQISYGNEQLSGEIIYTLSLISGENHNIDLYYKYGNEEKYFKNIEIYVKSVIIQEERIQWINPETVRIKINNL